jgi:hypothetical protein
MLLLALMVIGLALSVRLGKSPSAKELVDGIP